MLNQASLANKPTRFNKDIKEYTNGSHSRNNEWTRGSTRAGSYLSLEMPDGHVLARNGRTD